jgi:hypothetical protein
MWVVIFLSTFTMGIDPSSCSLPDNTEANL